MLTTKIIGNKITEARKKKSISQAQLAEQLFISPQAVGKWERGESMPDIITINRLSEILDVDLNYFSEGKLSQSKLDTSDEYPSEQTVEKTLRKQNKKISWDMSLGNWVDADFSGLKNLNEKFSSANLQRCQFVGSELSGLLLKGNHVVGCDFSNSNISNSHIQNSHLVRNQFESCSLKETEITGSHVNDCDFSGTDFSGAKIKSSDFSNNKIDHAIWNGTSFIGTQLGNIIFNGTLEDCSFENCAFKKVTFQQATLKNTFFKNKSLKNIRLEDCQVDRITYAFLKNGKADLTNVILFES